MGSAGVTIMYQKASAILNFPSIFSEILIFFTTVIAILIAIIYLIKTIVHFDIVRAEFYDRIRINFFASISISLLMLSIIYEMVHSDTHVYLFYIGTILQTFLTLYTISFWINHNFEIHHSNPAWFIPIVGNLLVPLAGSHILATNILLAYFAIGMFFWVVLFSITFNRIIFHHQLPEKFLPTFFIFIAPPAVGFIAYVKLSGTVDFFAHFLLSLAYFFAMLLNFMARNFLKIRYYISWWAFIFPLSAVTIASLLIFQEVNDPVYYYASLFFGVGATLSFLYVSFFTIRQILNGSLCIED